MIYFDLDFLLGSKITKEEFKELFPDADPDHLSCSSTEEEIDFENAFCAEDPYDSEILHRSVPIIEGSKSDLISSYKLAEDEL